MFLQRKFDEDLIEVLDLEKLFDPFLKKFLGRSHCGEEMQDPQMYSKEEVVFPSGEKLPRCWLDGNYRLKNA
jgi:hypothetical protein